jgi:ubiquinone biosynthesis protein COQ4
MSSHPEGRQILRDRPTVSSQTVDLDKLKGLRRGTLGREYVEWLVRGNVTPDTRETVSRAVEGKLTTRCAISTRLAWRIP